MKTWEQRRRQHDGVAIPRVVELFSEYGFAGHVTGVETDGRGLRKALLSKTDKASLAYRFRPDMIFTKAGYPSLMCEIKSEGQNSKNYAIEFLSFEAAKGWGKIHEMAMYIFVSVENGKNVHCCLIDNVCTPAVVFMPANHQDTRENKRYISSNHPNVKIIEKKRRNGSGTPYFLIPKLATNIMPFHVFMSDKLDLPEHPDRILQVEWDMRDQRRKLLFIGQSHLQPNMSTCRLETIFTKYQIEDSWNDVPLGVINKIYDEINTIIDKE